MAYKIAIIVGSLRKDSINRKVARSICALARRQSRLLDDRDRRPAALQPGPRRQSARAMDVRFREQVAAADGVLFVQPRI